MQELHSLLLSLFSCHDQLSFSLSISLHVFLSCIPDFPRFDRYAFCNFSSRRRMGLRSKLIIITFNIQAILLFLLFPFHLCSSQKHMKASANHTSDKLNKHKLVSPKLLFEITIHGFLLWASFGFLMPVGILTIRMANKEGGGRKLKSVVYVHAVLQMIAVLVATIGAIMSIKNFSILFNNTHQRIGVALYGIIWLQVLVGIFRPYRGVKRRIWFYVHWLLGTVVSLLGVLNVYTGLHAYQEKTSRSIRVWTTIFSVQLSSIVLFYLFQDKWQYIQKQGEVLGDDEPLRSNHEDVCEDKQKEWELAT